MDAPEHDLRLVEIRERDLRLRAIGLRAIFRHLPSSIGPHRRRFWRIALWHSSRRTSPQKRRRPRRARDLAQTPSRIERRSMIVRRPLKAAARPAIGSATSSSANAHGLCSSCMSESHESRSPRGSQENRRRNHLQQRCSRCSVASILNCEDQSPSTTTPPSPSTACSRTMRDMTTWFCDAYASWQKSGIENANGRLRRWLPAPPGYRPGHPTKTSRRSSSRRTSPPRKSANRVQDAIPSP